MNKASRQNKIVKMALQVLESQLKYQSESITVPSKVIDYLRLQLEDKDREHFLVLFLNNQNQLIASEVMFMGTINATEIHPREIAKRALKHNAAAVILAHNHPSGDPEPSQADRYITQKIEEVLLLIDVRTLDHFVVGRGQTVSFAERGWI